MRLRFVALTFAMAAACSDSTTAPSAHFIESVVLSQDSIRAGDSVLVQVALTNVTDEPQTYDPNYCIPFTAADSAGTNVTPDVFCASVLYPPTTLSAHGQVVQSWTWVTVLPAIDPIGPSSTPLPSGVYTVRGAITASDVTVVPVALRITP